MRHSPATACITLNHNAVVTPAERKGGTPYKISAPMAMIIQVRRGWAVRNAMKPAITLPIIPSINEKINGSMNVTSISAGMVTMSAPLICVAIKKTMTFNIAARSE